MNYRVYCPTKGGQWYPHECKADAMDRASKLSRENPGVEYHVYQDLGYYYTQPAQAGWTAL